MAILAPFLQTDPSQTVYFQGPDMAPLVDNEAFQQALSIFKVRVFGCLLLMYLSACLSTREFCGAPTIELLGSLSCCQPAWPNADLSMLPIIPSAAASLLPGLVMQ